MTIKFVPGKGWVTEGGMNVSAGSQDQADAMAQKNKVNSARRAMYGAYDQYMDQDNLSWLKNNIGDSWWWGAGRLDNLANDQDRFWKEFGTTGDDHYSNSAEIVNRYRALQESGMDKNQIQQAIYGNANLSPTFNNGGGGGGVTGPGMLSGNNPVNNNSNSDIGSWQSMLNPNNDLLKNLLYGDLRGMLSNEE
jgi:hypothetical protein